MKNVGAFCILCVVLPVFLSGCAINVTSRVATRLDLADMNTRLETGPTDLSVGGECPGTKSLKIVNGEMRTDKYCIDQALGGCRLYIIPKDFTDHVVKYMEDKLRASNIKVHEGLDNEIIISLEEIKSQEGLWSFGSFCKIKVQIPEINYTNTYVGESGSGIADLAAAYAIHLSIDNFFKDPVFQSYVRCKQQSGSL
ncbi:MAG: hypothetical protein ABSH41_30510 [Syntrophobacteraceae bacterium]|jgi:hypothetical protein